jgi:hypothetical protein
MSAPGHFQARIAQRAARGAEGRPRNAITPTARRRALWWLAGAAVPLRVGAQALQPPRGAVVLSIGGQIRHTNQGDRAALDMAMLEALTQRSFSTQTPWFKEPRKFTGPLLRDVLGLVGARGTTLRIGALNDYRADMPSDDARRHDVLLARLIDDKPIPVREKGPLFVIYPFDSDPSLRTPLYYSRSVWQVKSIDVL